MAHSVPHPRQSRSTPSSSEATSSASSQNGHDSDIGAAAVAPPAGQTVQSSAKASSASLRSLKDDLKSQLAKESLTLIPQLPSDVTFTRNQLRNAFLRLLFHAPFSGTAFNAESAMWTETTYAITAIYRTRLAKIERASKGPNKTSVSPELAKTSVTSSSSSAAESAVVSLHRNGSDTTPADQASKPKVHSHEWSRLAEALRTFLAREEAFWRGLAERFVTVFRLKEADAALERAAIADASSRLPAGPRALVGEDANPPGLARLPSGPTELSPEILQQANLPIHRERLIEIIHKILIFCGDLARYRERYREIRPMREPKNSRGGSLAHRGRGGRGSGRVVPSERSLPESRNYTDAILCYQAAKLLRPSDGHAWNQLAVCAKYQADDLGIVYNSYRALCVRVPFKGASVNIKDTLVQILLDWNKEDGPKKIRTASSSSRSLSEQERRLRCEKEFLIVEGLLYLRKEFASIPDMSDRSLRSFRNVISDKLLPTDIIVKMMTSSLAASWHSRLGRKATSRRKEDQNGIKASEEAWQAKEAAKATLRLSLEMQRLRYVLAMARVLLVTVTEQTRQALEDSNMYLPGRGPANQQASPIRNITGVSRRVLPALRVASKWLKSHLDYIDRCQSRCISNVAEGLSSEASAVAKASAAAEVSLIQGVEDFWQSYVDTINTLRFAFPFDSLPSLGTVGPTGAAALSLEEDIDLRGFVPNRRGMMNQDDSVASTAFSEIDSHPNQEQLMRIADLLVDAKVIAESDASPIVFSDEVNAFMVDSGSKAAYAANVYGSSTQPATGNLPAVQSRESFKRSASPTKPTRRSSAGSSSVGRSTTDTDIIDLAMRMAIEQRTPSSDESGSDDEDEILIPSLKNGKPTAVRSGQAISQHPLPHSETPSFNAPVQRAAETIPSHSVNAQDLLLNMLNGSSSVLNARTSVGGQPASPYNLGGPSMGVSGASQPLVRGNSNAFDSPSSQHHYDQHYGQVRLPSLSSIWNADPGQANASPWGPPRQAAQPQPYAQSGSQHLTPPSHSNQGSPHTGSTLFNQAPGQPWSYRPPP